MSGTVADAVPDDGRASAFCSKICLGGYVMRGNVIVGQSGGPTAVINSSLVGVFKTAKDRGAGKVYGMLHGIQVLNCSSVHPPLIWAPAVISCPVSMKRAPKRFMIRSLRS